MTADSSSRRYSAFISYSHRNSDWGNWLHKTIERWQTPRKLVGQDNRDGQVPKNLRPVFQDVHELPTASDLGAVISTALEQSRYLIVICSPDAARSEWVNEEILSFKRMGKANRILAIIVDGEPNASDMAGREAEECFPPALRFQLNAQGDLSATRAEPIAADARPGFGGKQRARLKLIAGLLGVNFDDLVGREKKRKKQRAMAVAGLAAVAGAAALLVGLEVRNEKLQAWQATVEKQTTEAIEHLDGDAVWPALQKLAAALPSQPEQAANLWPTRTHTVLNRAVSAQQERLHVTLDEPAVSIQLLQGGRWITQQADGDMLLFEGSGTLLHRFPSAADGMEISEAEYYLSDDQTRLVLSLIRSEKNPQAGSVFEQYHQVFRSKTYKVPDGKLIHEVEKVLTDQTYEIPNFNGQYTHRYRRDGSEYLIVRSVYQNGKMAPNKLSWLSTKTGEEVQQGPGISGDIKSLNFFPGVGYIAEARNTKKHDKYQNGLYFAAEEASEFTALWAAGKTQACEAAKPTTKPADNRILPGYALHRKTNTLLLAVPDVSNRQRYCIAQWTLPSGESSPLVTIDEDQLTEQIQPELLELLVSAKPQLFSNVMRGKGDSLRAVYDEKLKLRAKHGDYQVIGNRYSSALEVHTPKYSPWNIEGHEARVTALAIDDVADLLYTAAGDNTVRAWQLRGDWISDSVGAFNSSGLSLQAGTILLSQLDRAGKESAELILHIKGPNGDALQRINVELPNNVTHYEAKLLANGTRLGVTVNTESGPFFTIVTDDDEQLDLPPPADNSKFLLFDTKTGERLGEYSHDISRYNFPAASSQKVWLIQQSGLQAIDLSSGVAESVKIPESVYLEAVQRVGERFLLLTNNAAEEPENRQYQVYLGPISDGDELTLVTTQAAQAADITLSATSQRALIRWDLGYQPELEYNTALGLVDATGKHVVIPVSYDFSVLGDLVLSETKDEFFFADNSQISKFRFDGTSVQSWFVDSNWFEPQLTSHDYLVDDDSIAYVGNDGAEACESLLTAGNKYRFSPDGNVAAIASDESDALLIYDLKTCAVAAEVGVDMWSADNFLLDDTAKLWFYDSGYLTSITTQTDKQANLQKLMQWVRNGRIQSSESDSAGTASEGLN